MTEQVAELSTATAQPLSYADGAACLPAKPVGDFLASLVLPEVAKRMDGAPQFGVGGERMLAAGLEGWYPANRLSVRGYVEVLKKLPGILMLRRAMLKRISEFVPKFSWVSMRRTLTSVWKPS